MKAKSNRPLSFYIGVFALLSLGFFLAKRRLSAKPPASVSMPAQRQIQVFEAPQSGPHLNKKELQFKRQKTLAQLHMASTRVTPQSDDRGLLVNFELRPQGRSCKLGDLEMMEKIVGTDGRVMVSVSDDAGQSLLERSVTLAQLKQPLALSLRLERSKTLKIYRLALCSDNGKESCQRAAAADFKSVELSIISDKAKSNRRPNVLLHSLTFTSFDGEIQVLDATRSRGDQITEQLVRSFQGQPHQTRFLNRALQDQNRLGSVPAQVKGNGLVLPLYFNDSSACIAAGGRLP